jgi:LPXTG-site transpeptidase (sortase) family protein
MRRWVPGALLTTALLTTALLTACGAPTPEPVAEAPPTTTNASKHAREVAADRTTPSRSGDVEQETAPVTAPATEIPMTSSAPPAVARATTAIQATATPVVGPAPVAIRSGAIGLQSVLEHVGLQADDGGVEVPDFALAGWYRFGSRPGQPGPTVIVGHVDSRSGPAVFFRLRELDPGDTVEVELADGTIAVYEVIGTQQFPKAEFPTFEVFGGTDTDLLRLVTCTGAFDRDMRSYFDNLVVTAERIA